MAIDQFANLKKDIRKEKERLESSPSFYSPGLSPSQKDLSQEKRVRSLEKQLSLGQAKKAASEWYGDDNDKMKVEKPKQGLFDWGIDALNAPLYGAVGALKSISGKSDTGLIDSINKSVEGRDTFGDYLASMGVSSPIAGPLGFVLDVGVSTALDPFALIGKGARYTSSLWRAGAGASAGAKRAGLKGAMEGVESAVKSSALEKASYLTRHTPFLKNSKTGEKVYKATKEATERFEKNVGETFKDYIDKEVRTSWYGPGAREELEKTFKQYAPKGEWIWDNFVGKSSEKWVQNQIRREILTKAGAISEGRVVEEAKDIVTRSAGRFAKDPKALPRTSDPLMKEVGLREVERTAELGKKAGLADDLPPISVYDDLPPVSQAAGFVDDVPDHLKIPVTKIRNEVDEVNEVARFSRAASEAETPSGIVERFLEEAKNDIDLTSLYKYIDEEGVSGATGFRSYDKLMKKARSWKPLKNSPRFKDTAVLAETLDFYEKFIGMFRIAKVFANPASYTYAVMGNTAMAGMMGINVTRGTYFKRVRDAFNIIRGKAPTEVLQSFLEHPQIGSWAKENPRLFAKVYGFNMSSLTAENIFRNMKNSPELLKLYKELGSADAVAAKFNSLAKAMKDGQTNDLIMDALKKASSGVPSPEDIPISFASNVLDYGAMQKWTNNLKAKADAGDKISGLMHKYLTKPGEMYNMTDQSSRLGLFMQLAMDGVTPQEVEKLQRFYNISSENLTESWVKGQRLLKFNPEKAVEITADVYMNYAAMPAAVKVLRQVPILGSPFASFSYAMLGKTAQTIAFNPTYFSKLNLGIHEAGLALAGPKTPMEKAALEGNQSYLDSPWMLRLARIPFFADHPVYLNLQNATPFLTNLLSSSERTWSDSFKGRAGGLLDGAPVMKDPIGALIMSHFVLPFLLEEGQQPQNFFGGQLYPKSATGTQKAGYVARDLAESVVPGFAGLAALPVNMLGGDAVRSQEAIEMVPLYRYRKLMQAMQGKSASGSGSIKNIEAPSEKQAQTLYSMAGFNFNPVNLTSKKETKK